MAKIVEIVSIGIGRSYILRIKGDPKVRGRATDLKVAQDLAKGIQRGLSRLGIESQIGFVG